MRILPIPIMSMSMSSCPATITTTNSYVIGLNAALQKRFVVMNESKLIPGNVHRASYISTGIIDPFSKYRILFNINNNNKQHGR